MTVRALRSDLVELVGDCSMDDAEVLLRLLSESPLARIDLRSCERVHAAVAQILLASRAPIIGPAGGAFLQQWVEPALRPR